MYKDMLLGCMYVFMYAGMYVCMLGCMYVCITNIVITLFRKLQKSSRGETEEKEGVLVYYKDKGE